MKMEIIKVPEQSVAVGLAESKSNIEKLLRDMNDVALSLKDEAKQDQLLELNEKIFQELQNLVNEYHTKTVRIKNLLSSKL